ncbi:hypothetical protein [Planktotalea sp.]|uniref:hypothetical protein n=1 Tax=Planktotalea sp. TaxID=2029877 RepID=UPI003D6C6112
MKAQTLTNVRLIVLGIAGLVCASYSGLAILWDNPQPFSPWLPGIAGVFAAIVITLSAILAGPRNTQIAMDELYRAEWGKAVQISYWIGILLFIAGAVAITRDWISPAAGIAAAGTAYGASPMLLFCLISLRG